MAGRHPPNARIPQFGSIIANLTSDISRTVEGGLETVSERTRGLRQNVNTTLNDVSSWIADGKTANQQANRSHQLLAKDNKELREKLNQMNRLFQVQADLFEKKLKSLTEQIDRLENVNYNQKDEIRQLHRQVAKRDATLKKMEKKITNIRPTLKMEAIFNSVEKLEDDDLTKLAAQILQTQSQRREQRLRNKECSVCFTDVKVVAFVPCGHLCVCEACASQIEQSTNPSCPICREPTTSHFRVYD